MTLADFLRRNDPENTKVSISLRDFRNDNDVVAVAQLLRAHEYASYLDFTFPCLDNAGDRDVSHLDWLPLLQVIETRQELQKVRVAPTIAVGRYLPLFREGFFQALQRNPNLHSLEMCHIYLSSENSAGLVSFLDGAPSLKFLSFAGCRMESGDAANSIAASLQRNSRIQVLHLLGNRSDVLRPILLSLATSQSASTLKELSYQPWGGGEVEATVVDALQQYLDSASATIQCLNLHCAVLSPLPETNNILQSISRNASITEVAFNQCSITVDTPAHRQLSHLVREKSNLAKLGISRCNFLDSPDFCDALAEVLRRRASPLQCLEFALLNVQNKEISFDNFRNLASAIVGSGRLEELVITAIDVRAAAGRPLFQTLVDAIPLFKAKETTLRFFTYDGEEDQLRVLAAFKRNYVVQSVKCKDTYSDVPWFSASHQTQLDFYLNRNHKLAAWVESPKMVPEELWSYAIMLALNAGLNTFYQSLLALSGHGVGLRDRCRKRKRT